MHVKAEVTENRTSKNELPPDTPTASIPSTQAFRKVSGDCVLSQGPRRQDTEEREPRTPVPVPGHTPMAGQEQGR